MFGSRTAGVQPLVGVDAELAIEEQASEERLQDVGKETQASKVVAVVEMFEQLFSAYLSGEREEQRELVRLACSNLVVTGKSVSVEPKKWLELLMKRGDFLSGGPDRSRTGTTHLSRVVDCRYRTGPVPLTRKEILQQKRAFFKAPFR